MENEINVEKIYSNSEVVDKLRCLADALGGDKNF